jgi:LemA protein
MLIPLIILAVIALTGLGIYNSLISKKNQVRNALSSIDVMLKKRFDLLPNLVVVKQYMQHESGVLKDLTSLRTQGYNAALPANEKAALDAGLTKGVRSLMITAENYPDLKANTNFIQLQAAWTESEEQIAAARRTFNAAVTSFNDAVMMFPGRLVAGMMNYDTMEVISIPEEERANISARDLFAGKNA